MAKTANVFISGIILTRNSEGKWLISKVNTNHGKFDVGPAENAAITNGTNILDDVCSHIVQELRPNLQEFIQQELKEQHENS